MRKKASAPSAEASTKVLPASVAAAGDQADAAGLPGAAARPRRLPLVDVVVVVGVLDDERVGAFEEEAVAGSAESARGL